MLTFSESAFRGYCESYCVRKAVHERNASHSHADDGTPSERHAVRGTSDEWRMTLEAMTISLQDAEVLMDGRPTGSDAVAAACSTMGK